MSIFSKFSKFGKSTGDRMSRRLARLNNKANILSKKLDVANLKANIKSAKHGGNVSVNKGKAVTGIIAGALTSRHLLNNKMMDNQRNMLNSWLTSLEKREKDKNKKQNKKDVDGADYE